MMDHVNVFCGDIAKAILWIFDWWAVWRCWRWEHLKLKSNCFLLSDSTSSWHLLLDVFRLSVFIFCEILAMQVEDKHFAACTVLFCCWELPSPDICKSCTKQLSSATSKITAICFRHFESWSHLDPEDQGLEVLLLLEAPLSVEVPALDFQVAVHLEVFQVAVHLEVLLPEPMRNEARKKSSLFFRFRCSWASETFKDTSFSPPASFYSRAGHQHLLMHISCTDPSYAELSYKTNLKKSSPHALAWNFWSCCRRHFLGRFWLWTFKWWSAWRCCCWGLSDIKTGKPNCGQQVDIVRALRFLFSFFAHFAMKFHGHKHAAACKLLFSRCVSPSPDT